MQLPSSVSAHFRARRLGARCLILLLFSLLGALTASPAAAQTGSISGFVVDSLGNRISNATITATSGPSAPRQARSASNGAYLLSRLNPGRYTFVAERTGFESGARSFNVISGTDSRVDFTLQSNTPQGAGLQGTVLRRGTNSPVPGALIQLTGGAGFPAQTTTTDSSGAYRFTNLPGGRVRALVSRDGFIDESRQVTLTEGVVRTENFSLRLRTGGAARISGVVSDDSGTPVRNARVVLADGISAGLSDTTDSRGRYSITQIIPDVYSVEATATNFAPGGRNGVVLSEGAAAVLNITLSALGETDASIDGLVVDTVGNPIQGARVAITSGPVSGRSDVTDALGAYLLDNLPAGNYGLQVSATDFETQTRTVTVIAGATLRIDFVLQDSAVEGNGTIAGDVTRADTTAVSGATVRTTAGPVVGASTTTDADGDYALPNLPEGTYTITVSKSGFASQTISSIEVNAGETTSLNVVLGVVGNGGTLTGSVTDAEAFAIQGVTVGAYLNGDLVRSGTSNTSGRYTLTGLDAGTYTIRASKTGYITEETDDVVITSDQTTDLDFELQVAGNGTGTIAGLVVDPTSRAVQNALVELTGPAGARQARTNAEGRFEFTNLPAGTDYSITVSANGLNPETRNNLQLEADQRVNLRFNLTQQIDGGGSIAGMVRAPNGQGISGARVTIVSGPAIGQTRTTAINGQFNFTGLPGGVYTLQTTASGFRASRTSVYVRPGNGAYVIITMRR